MKIVKILLTVLAMALSCYVLLSKDFALMSFMILSLGALMLVTGLVETQKDRKDFLGYLNIIGSLFLIFISIQVFLAN